MTAWPEIDPGAAGVHAEWYAANVAAGALTVQRCAACSTLRHPARLRCASCHSDEYAFDEVATGGAVVTLTVTHRALHPSFADVVPYAIAVVELDDGPRLLTVLREDDPSSAAAAVGRRVTVRVDRFGVPHALPGDRR